jgi:hypothetical protein
MKEANNIKFLGLELDKYMNWKNHIGKILPIMSSECYVIRSMYHLSSKTTLKMIYFAYFHSVMEYRIAFWGGIAESKRVFQLQKRIIRIITGSNSRTSCKPLFRSLEILTLPSQYTLSLCFCYKIWQIIHATLQFMELIQEINYNCINRHLISHYIRGECILWVLKFLISYLVLLQILYQIKSVLYWLWKVFNWEILLFTWRLY